MKQYITIKGAKEHNLKNIDIKIPRDELVVVTGLSGSGKSSLAFDTIYAEGQRRYMESLSSYARQFLGQAEKPEVEKIEGLSPAISIDQKSTNRNPRSTVGTVTEIYDYFRLLYARIGIPHCTNCGKEIKKQSVDQMVDQIMELPEGSKIQLLSPVVRGRKGEHAKVFERAKRSGYVRVRVDGNLYELTEEIKLEKNSKAGYPIICVLIGVITFFFPLQPVKNSYFEERAQVIEALAEDCDYCAYITGDAYNWKMWEDYVIYPEFEGLFFIDGLKKTAITDEKFLSQEEMVVFIWLISQCCLNIENKALPDS